MSDSIIEEEQLHAYVDGELDAKERERVEAYLEAHPEAAAMVAEWAAQNAALQALFPAADHPIELPILEADTLETANEPRAPLRSQVRALAASVAILAVGLAMGWGGHGYFGPEKTQISEISVAGLVDQAIAAHVVFASDSARPVEIGADDEALLIKWLSNRLGQELTAPDLRVQGYELVGGRLLSSNTGPAAQFMYENTEGTRITVFASRPQDSRMAEFSYQRGAFSGEDTQVGSFYWQDENLQYAVVGDAPREELSALAVAVYRALS